MAKQLIPPPIVGEMAMVTLHVKVLFEWSDQIVEDMDDDGNPVAFKSGLIMKVFPDQKIVYNNEPHLSLGHTFKEAKPKESLEQEPVQPDKFDQIFEKLIEEHCQITEVHGSHFSKEFKEGYNACMRDIRLINKELNS